MKNHMLLFSNLIIIISIVLGFTGIVYRDTKAYQDLAETHMKNIVSLADTDISKQIESSMSKPVMVSKTMANDEFLKTWLAKEPKNVSDRTYLEQLYSYLKAYQAKYDYTTVFCVSSATGNYYYQDGLNKTISENDEHDIWYYNFINSHHESDIQVDTNQSSNNTITVFVNFRVEDDNGALLGVIGVGLQVSSIEDMIRSYEKDYDLSVFIINVGGAENSFSGDTGIFINQDEITQRTGISDEINMNKSDASEMQWFTSGGARQCLITKYNDTLGWYLILEKNTNSISSAFQERIKNNIVFMFISLALCIMVTTVVFLNYNKRVIKKENTDELTGLWNRKYFSKQYLSIALKYRKQNSTLFMLDIDRFKNINDTYGHLFGNAVLSKVGRDLKNAIHERGVAARWGGDEFLGILSVGPKEAEETLRNFMDGLKSEEEEIHCHVTVSTGITEFNGALSLDEMIKKADEAMYSSKETGRDKISSR